MLKPGGGFASKERGIQTMHCSSCGKNLGTQGWEGQKEFNDVEEKGWKFCPYCGEPLYNINNEFHISFEREMTILKELAAGNKGVRNYDVDIICIGF